MTTVPFGWMYCPPSGTVAVAELVGLTATIPFAKRRSQADPTCVGAPLADPTSARHAGAEGTTPHSGE